MILSHYIKTDLVSSTIYTAVVISTVSTFSMAHAASNSALLTNAGMQTVSQEALTFGSFIKTGYRNTQPNTPALNIYKIEYMKSTYRDFELNLVGPLKISFADDHSQRHFTNLNSSKAKRVRTPFGTNTYENTIYYRSTVAKTGFKIKF